MTDPRIRAEAALAIARGICLQTRGASSACYCEGDLTRCHAATIYRDFGVGAILGLQKAGLEVVRVEVDSGVSTVLDLRTPEPVADAT